MTRGGDAAFACSQESTEHYTPRTLWKRAIRTMGAIDVDPASDADNNVPAAIHYTVQHDGLTKPWDGRVWLNPPFGRGVDQWFRKLELEILAGRTTEAIVLWKAALETRSMRILTRIPEYRCSAAPRVRISYASGEKKRGGGDSATFSTLLHYFGPDRGRQKFIEVFSEIADIWVCAVQMGQYQRRLW